MTKVLVICKGFPPTPGGIETFSEQLARAYLRSGSEVTVVTQTYGPYATYKKSYLGEGDLNVINVGPGDQIRTGLRMARVVMRLTRSEQFELIHATTWRAAATTMSARIRVPLVISVHGREVLTVPIPLRPLAHSTFKRAQVVAAVSQATRDRAAGAWGQTLDTQGWLVVGNGLSYQIESEIPPHRTVETARGQPTTPLSILTLARLVERKNVQGCLRALGILQRTTDMRFTYTIAGAGPMLQQLKTQAEMEGISESVCFLGYVPEAEVPTLYRSNDVFLHPQIDLDSGRDFEGFGLVIADALSFGCAVIAGSGSGPSDFIFDGKTGLLVDGQQPQAIATAIERLGRDHDLRRSLAISGRTFARANLSWDRHIRTIRLAVEQRAPSKN